MCHTDAFAKPSTSVLPAFNTRSRSLATLRKERSKPLTVCADSFLRWPLLTFADVLRFGLEAQRPVAPQLRGFLPIFILFPLWCRLGTNGLMGYT